MNRLAVAFLSVVGVSSAHAEVEIGGTAGVHIFSDTNALSTQKNDEVSQANSALFAARLGYLFTDMLGVEIEGGVVPTESTGGNVVFDIYNVTVRANLIAQLRAGDPSNTILPFATVGGGMMRVVDIGTTDESLFRKETDGLAFVGVGAKYRAGGGWGVRLEFRALFVPDNTDASFTNDFEVLASLYRGFGGKRAPVKEDEKKETPAGDEDPDGDGVLGAADQCPNEAEDKDGFQDEDGCPDADNDGDGVGDANDKCPNEAEDKDNFQDDDGCPDPDNDGDGVPDAADKCGDQPETRNGFEDDDGCPDELPAALTQVIGPVKGVNFKVNAADLLPASNKALDKVAAALAEVQGVKVEVQAHTDDQALKAGGKFADNDELSQARAEAVKAYLVSKGVAEDRIVAKGYGSSKPAQDPEGLKGAKLNAARAANRRVELQVVTGDAPAADASE